MPCLTGNEINRQNRDAVSMFPGKELKVDLPEMGYMGIPGIECLGGKKLAVVFYGGGDGEKPGNFISWRESMDGGASWSGSVPAVVPLDMERQRVFDPCLWLAPDRKLWLFFASACQKTDHARVMAGVAEPPYRARHYDEQTNSAAERLLGLAGESMAKHEAESGAAAGLLNIFARG